MQDEFKQIIKKMCEKNNIEYKVLSKDWVIRISKNGIVKFIVGMNFPLNDQASAAILRDKFATYAVLKEGNVPVIEYNIIFNPTTRSEFISDIDDLESYFNKQKNGAIVIKANDGSSGKEVYKCTSYNEAKTIIDECFHTKDSLSVCPFYNIELEYRLVYLNGEVKLIFGKKAAPGNWKHNLSEGASVINDIDDDTKKKLISIADDAVKATNSTFASVDIIKTNENELLVMEINSSVCLLKFAETSEENRIKAERIYEEALLFSFI